LFSYLRLQQAFQNKQLDLICKRKLAQQADLYRHRLSDRSLPADQQRKARPISTAETQLPCGIRSMTPPLGTTQNIPIYKEAFCLEVNRSSYSSVEKGMAGCSANDMSGNGYAHSGRIRIIHMHFEHPFNNRLRLLVSEIAARSFIVRSQFPSLSSQEGTADSLITCLAPVSLSGRTESISVEVGAGRTKPISVELGARHRRL